MLPNPWYNIGIFRLLLEVLETLEVRKVLLFIRGLREGHGNMLPCNPLIEVVFDLSKSINYEEEKKKKPYNRQDQGERRQRKHLIFKKLWVHHTIVLLSPEPGFVDERLDDRCQEYPSFLLGILLGWGQKFLFKRLYK